MTETIGRLGKLGLFLLAGNWVLAGERIPQPNPAPPVFVAAVAAKKGRPVADFVVGPKATLPGTGDPGEIEFRPVTDVRVRPVDVCFAFWSGFEVVVFAPRPPSVTALQDGGRVSRATANSWVQSQRQRDACWQKGLWRNTWG